MTLKLSDRRVDGAIHPYNQALAETLDTAEAVLVMLNEWVAENRLPKYDPDLHVALTRLVIERATEIRGSEELGNLREFVSNTKPKR